MRLRRDLHFFSKRAFIAHLYADDHGSCRRQRDCRYRVLAASEVL